MSRERENEEEEEEGERKPFAWRIYCKPLRSPVIEGSSRAPEVPGVSQRHSGSTYPPVLAKHAHTCTCSHAFAHTHIRTSSKKKKPCHSTAPASNTKATSSHCVRPSPFIPFSTACTTTKAEKLGSDVDDRATNLFGGTHYISRLYSSAAERAELNMDMQRWPTVWRWVHQQWPVLTSGIIHTFHMGQMPPTGPSSLNLIQRDQLILGHKWIAYPVFVCVVAS